MMKFITGIVLFVVLVFVAINVAGNVILAKAMEATLGVKVDVEKVQLGLFTQQAGIYGLKVHNPDGFKEDTLASVPEMAVSYDLSGILQRKLRIKEIRLNLDEITVERNVNGKFNLTELKPMQKSSSDESGEPSKDKPAPSEPAKKGEAMDVTIDEVRLSLGRARYVDSKQGQMKEFPLEVKDAIMKDVTDPKEVVQQIVVKTMQKVGLNALMPDLGQMSATLKGEAMDGMKDSLGQLSEKVKLPFGK